MASDKDQEVHPLLPRLQESHLSFPVLSPQWELPASGPGLSAPRTEPGAQEGQHSSSLRWKREG